MTRTRIGIAIAAVVGLARVAHAQPAPAPTTPPPAPAGEPPAEPAPAPTTEPAPPVEAAPVEPTPAVEEEAPPEKLKAGKQGFFQPGVLLQGWYFVDRADKTTNAFRLRRAEIHVKGQIIPDRVAYAVMIDPAKVLEAQNVEIPTTPPITVKAPVGNISVLQDFYVTYLTPWADVSIGQFKIPVSWEGYNSSSKLLFPERAAVSRTFGDKRDLGLRVTKTFNDKVMYSAGVFNGAGLNNADTNNGKDLGLRLEYYPVKGATVAGVGYMSVGDRDEPGAKDRYELDGRYEVGAILIQAEALRARDVGAAGAKIDGQGAYAAVAYRHATGLQPALRVGFLDPDVDKDDDQQVHFDLGLNYYLQDHQAKGQLSYSRTQFGGGTTADNLFILAAQVSY